MEKLSKIISYALRHRPDKYNLILDQNGWVFTDDLLQAIRALHPHFSSVDRDSIVEIIQQSDKSRFEIDEYSVRALYGHSVVDKIIKEAVKPPDRLYHGTSEKNAQKILQQGLRPMGRQYVHLSIDTQTAVMVAKRRTNNAVVLEVAAQEASRHTAFYIGNCSIWLADRIPGEFISRL